MSRLRVYENPEINKLELVLAQVARLEGILSRAGFNSIPHLQESGAMLVSRLEQFHADLTYELHTKGNLALQKKYADQVALLPKTGGERNGMIDKEKLYEMGFREDKTGDGKGGRRA